MTCLDPSTMTKVEMVGRVSEEQQHQVDGAAVCAQGDRVYVGADDGKVKVRLGDRVKVS